MTLVDTISYSSLECPECGGPPISAYERGEMVCRQCGLVISEKCLDTTHSGVRAFSKLEYEKKARTGNPISELSPDIGYSTIIDRKDIKNYEFKRIAKWHSNTSWENKNIMMALMELKRIASNLNIPSVVKKTAIQYYKIVFKKDLLRGRSINGMIAACLYLGCKKEQHPITFQEIINEASNDSSLVKKCYKVLIKELNVQPKGLNPVALVPKYIAELHLGMDMENMTTKVLASFLKKNNHCGKDPKGLCAGAIYLVSKLTKKRISQKSISDVVGVTEVTLRSRYKEILNQTTHF